MKRIILAGLISLSFSSMAEVPKEFEDCYFLSSQATEKFVRNLDSDQVDNVEDMSLIRPAGLIFYPLPPFPESNVEQYKVFSSRDKSLGCPMNITIENYKAYESTVLRLEKVYKEKCIYSVANTNKSGSEKLLCVKK